MIISYYLYLNEICHFSREKHFSTNVKLYYINILLCLESYWWSWSENPLGLSFLAPSPKRKKEYYITEGYFHDCILLANIIKIIRPSFSFQLQASLSPQPGI